MQTASTAPLSRAIPLWLIVLCALVFPWPAVHDASACLRLDYFFGSLTGVARDWKENWSASSARRESRLGLPASAFRPPEWWVPLAGHRGGRTRDASHIHSGLLGSEETRWPARPLFDLKAHPRPGPSIQRFAPERVETHVRT